MTEPAWLTTDELDVWLSFLACSTSLLASLDRQLQRDAGIPQSWYGVLAILSDQPGRTARQSSLAMTADFSLSRLSHAVTKLEQRGWISRATDPSDRRATLVTLTPAGAQALGHAAPGHAAEVRRLFLDRLTAAQAQGLRDACRSILAGLDGPPPDLVPPPGAACP